MWSELSNDHKAVTKQIDKLLQELHAAQKPSVSHAKQEKPVQPASDAARQPATAPPVQGDEHAAASRPFAVVNSVSPSSPASSAGMLVCLS